MDETNTTITTQTCFSPKRLSYGDWKQSGKNTMGMLNQNSEIKLEINFETYKKVVSTKLIIPKIYLTLTSYDESLESGSNR